MNYSKVIKIGLLCMGLIGAPIQKTQAVDPSQAIDECIIVMDLCEAYVASTFGYSTDLYWSNWNQCANNFLSCLSEVTMN